MRSCIRDHARAAPVEAHETRDTTIILDKQNQGRCALGNIETQPLRCRMLFLEQRIGCFDDPGVCALRWDPPGTLVLSNCFRLSASFMQIETPPPWSKKTHPKHPKERAPGGHEEP